MAGVTPESQQFELENEAVEFAAAIENGHGIAWVEEIVVASVDVADAESRTAALRTAYMVRYFDRDAVDRAAGTSALRGFARWVRALDDPTDAQGAAARRTVTLTEICGRAEKAELLAS